MDNYERRCRAAVLGHPGFGLKTGTIGAFERSVNEYDCITLALITALHGVYDLQIQPRCDRLAYMKNTMVFRS